ncbi:MULTISPECIES: DUF3422 family protein [Pseudomonas]|uniref:DUF3422 domain-containing protein n=1 Tax=Pseudomonas juntendi TaxID=2666183 RepID=A0ABD4YIT5_9PSED|nr:MULTISPECIES: DUF3422 family protein [Pseudomonas]MDH0759192.1 DUF3422 domain-containing protein [Pseudomonas juntendi]MDH1575426.1 DUF3422 domain-containing protein [Pseudomonas sp. GD03746]MDH1919940.1 DUF3422 domain-containing protein [Pseudomonas juntendi]QUN68622.1 DUF3422 family protein [Pseudomonas sp. JS425]
MHSLRIGLHNELHARPSIYFHEPAHVFHMALLEEGNALDQIVGKLETEGENTATHCRSQGLLRLDGFSMKWERHTEFLSLTLVLPKSEGGEFWPAIPDYLESLVSGHEHLIVECTQILVEAEDSWEVSVRGIRLA